MTVLLQNRTISMILTVPDVEIFAPSSTSIAEKLDRSDIDKSYSIVKHDQSSDIDSISSMPVYHGSILRIEKHNDDQNASDLIIRVPNFQRLSLPSDNTDSKQPARIKRRAPICPILYGPTPNLSTTNITHNFDNLNLSQTRVSNTNRLTTGLRSLSRAFTHGCKSKRSSVISEITVPSALPDVEVMTEKLEIPKSSNKNLKHPNSIPMIPKLSPPKILFIKRKHLKIRKKQPSSSISMDTQTDRENNRINLTPTSTIITTEYAEVKKDNLPRMTTFFHQFIESNDSNQETNIVDNDNDDDDDDDKEQHNETMRLSFDVEQQFTAISQLVSDFPISSIDADSLSTHRYSTISATVPDIRISITDNDTEDISSTGILYDFDTKPTSQPIRSNIPPKIDQPFRVQTSILQPDISVIRIGTSDLRTKADRRLPEEEIDSTSNIEQQQNEESQIEQGWYGVIHPDDETFAECYEVTYQIDPRYQNEKNQIQDLTTWLPIIPQNEYEQIERDHSIDKKSQQFQSKDRSREHLETISKDQDVLINNIIRNKSRSVDDLSRTSNDQTFTYQPESIAASSSSEISSRYCSLRRSNSYNGFGIYVSTDAETRREHFIRQVEDLSPGEQAGLKENDRILCINGTSVINEDYTVVLQLIKHGLQTDTLDFDVITNDAYEQFKSQIDQLYQ